MRANDLIYLQIPLPEDLRKLKGHGDFARMERVLEMRLAAGLPECLKKRLLLEREIIRRIPGEYPHTREQALRQMQEAVEGFTEDELDRLRDQDAADWIYVEGELRFRRNFRANLLKTRPELAARLKQPELIEAKLQNFRLLDDTLAHMRAQGGMAVRVRLRASLRLKPGAERPGEALCVHLPLPIETEDAQIRAVRLIGAEPAPAHIAPPDAAQRTVSFAGIYPAGQEFSVEYEFENHMRLVRPDPARVSPVQPDFCLGEEPPHIVFTPLLKALAREITGDEPNPLVRARKIYDHLTTRVIYSYVRPYLTIENLPEYMAAGCKGDCGIFALLFITLLRICGVPAEWQSGLYTAPGGIDCHDWARFYIAPYGWLYADCSFGNAAYHAGSEARREFYFGNLDPYRMPAARRFQQDFDPPLRYLRSDPYDNQSGEAEYCDAPVPAAQLQDAQQLLSLEEIPCKF